MNHRGQRNHQLREAGYSRKKNKADQAAAQSGAFTKRVPVDAQADSCKHHHGGSRHKGEQKTGLRSNELFNKLHRGVLQ